MKKWLSLVLSLGLLAILALDVSLPAQAADEVPGDAVTGEGSPDSELGDPPWYDETWHYRRPVVISNGGAGLTYYQVLVRLDNDNFDFSKAKAGGADIRFTLSDGTTELKYWIESWNTGPPPLAYIWVRVAPLVSGNTTIYLYYNNPAAAPLSNGASTFDGFDDNWSQFTGTGADDGETIVPPASGEIDSIFVWSKLSGTPVVSAGILSLTPNTGIKSTPPHQYNAGVAVGFQANFTSGSGNEWAGFIDMYSGKRTSIGDLTNFATKLYLINYSTGYENVQLGNNDWHNFYHIYEARWHPGKSTAAIDHTALASTTTQVPDVPLPVTFFNNAGSNAILMVDWAYVRQYRDPEPVVQVGAQQGLVELRIAMIDSPDPIPQNRPLTYQITVSNIGTIDAPGVVVTDALPGSVSDPKVYPSQGICTGYPTIVCDLGLIPANGIASITIIAFPNTDGSVTNSASVASPGYELDLSNNTSTAVTLVDSVPPVVTWVSPVVDDKNIYITFGGKVTLLVNASDNDQIARVDFNLYDHVALKDYVLIGRDSTAPYQMDFASQVLVCGEVYQLYAYAYDRAGNFSRNRILIERLCVAYLPLMMKR